MTALLYDTLRWTHLLAGGASLILFWVPALTRKGGRTHRAAGRWYVRGMATVILTALPLSALSFIEGEWVTGLFLAYLAIITSSSLWYGRAVLEVKQDSTKLRTRAHAALGISNLVAAITILVLAWTVTEPGFGRTLFTLFSLLGFSTAWDTRKFFLNPPVERQWWRYEHMNGMIGTGIAAHTAFGAFGMRRLIPELSLGALGLIPWLAPTIIGVISIQLLTRRYRREFAPERDRSGAAGTATPGIAQAR